MYSSQITEWRKLRDAGLLSGKNPGREDRPADRGAGGDRPVDKGVGLDPPAVGENRSGAGSNGKSSRALGGYLRERGHREDAAAALTGCYDELVGGRGADPGRGGVDWDCPRRPRTGDAAEPVQPPAEPACRPVPVNKLSDAESAELVAVLNSQRFVDKAPPQIYATLLAEGTYLCSISTMYRILERNRQVKDRRRQATHPPRAVPELQATGPRQVYSLGHHQTRRPDQGPVLRLLRNDRHLLQVHRRRARAQHRDRSVGGRFDDRGLRSPGRPARGPRRPWHIDDQQTRRGPAG